MPWKECPVMDERLPSRLAQARAHSSPRSAASRTPSQNLTSDSSRTWLQRARSGTPERRRAPKDGNVSCVRKGRYCAN
jgi:hypothetical protein